MFSRAPTNHVVHSMPRESSSTSSHGRRERDAEIVDDGTPEAIGLVDRDTVELVVGRAAERAREPTDVRGVELLRRRGPCEVSRPALASLGLHEGSDLRRGEPQVVDAGVGLVRALHDHARQHGRERRAAVDPARPRRRPLGARVDRHRLRADVRVADADRRQARRRLRTPADLRHRDRRLHARVARVRPRELVRDADRRSRPPGRRRRADEPGDALDHRGDVPAARSGARRSGSGPGRLGARARDRPARRRSLTEHLELELDLLRQRPDRHPRDRRELPLHRRVARRDARERSTCPASPRRRSASSR